MIWKNNREGMRCLKGGIIAIPLLAIMLMIGTAGATTIDVNIQGLGDDLTLGKDYANFTIAVTNATNLSKVQLWGGTNASNLTLLKEWTDWGLTGGAGYYNWTNLSDGVKYYWKVAVLDNGTWYNKTGNFTIELSNFMVYLTGEEAYKTWITAGLFLLGLALQGSKEFRKIGAILLIIGIILGLYWFMPSAFSWLGGGS